MKDKTKPVWHGVVLIAGGAIGAGMFALPMVSAGMWFSWATAGLMVTWWVTYLAAKLLVEVNLSFDDRASFHTMVRSVLGAPSAWLNDLAIAFIMMILMYAYISAGAGILEHSLNTITAFDGALSPGFLSALFALFVGVFVWLGTSMVSRITTVFLLGLVISFVTASAEMATYASWATLLPSQNEGAYFKFLWAGIPVFVTAFACAGLVPSLVSHYRTEPDKIFSSLLIGTLIVLLIYFVWLAITFASLPRSGYEAVIEQGSTLQWFSHFAIVTSFLSIGLGLFHFLCDGLNLSNSRIGRAKAALLAFMPPVLMSVLLPYGFVSVIGFAGLLVAFSFFIVPAWMHIKQHGLSLVSVSVAMFGVLVAVLKVSLLLNLLPV